MSVHVYKGNFVKDRDELHVKTLNPTGSQVRPPNSSFDFYGNSNYGITMMKGKVK